MSLPNPGNPTGEGWRHTSGHMGSADTELNAAVNGSHRVTYRERLLTHYVQVGELGATDPEAQAATGMSLPGDAGARRHELVALGHEIVDTGIRRMSPRGKPCIAWVLLEKTEEPAAVEQGLPPGNDVESEQLTLV